MNNIIKRPIRDIGYGFIDPAFLPKGKNEYHLRNRQNRNGIHYRKLTTSEIEMLVRNNNSSDNWNNILVSDAFNPDLVKNCTFFGLVRIGKLEPFFLEFKNLRLPVGLYNSTIVSCDFGDNVVIDNVNYLAHYIIGNEVMIANVNELATTSTAKFGNGIVKQGEKESIRIWLEVCNENGGRAIVPFNGMLPGDAYLWAKFRNDEKMLEKFMQFTEKKFDKQRGYYGKIGDRTVIKNCRMIKDVWMGSDIYMKGANKIKNLTINSSPEAPTQIGEGCELVNGIIGVGCKVFYGVKAVRFIMASHSQLKYGARLINSYLGNNSTISCCEVLNSLIFPFHEQHHNNSFLCASLVEGQSNMAAGATIGSNHNSRSADGEIIAGRGFWPGLSVSLKHNSRFATFTIISKGAYPAELDIRIPFSLVSDDVTNNRLVVMPGYWFMYNFYALTRNEWKYEARDQRTEKTQRIETCYLAPDSVNEMFRGLELMQEFTGRAWYRANNGNERSRASCIRKGRDLLDTDNPVVDELEILC
jgi:NDP-sugar pyrophosphorylase family protein